MAHPITPPPTMMTLATAKHSRRTAGRAPGGGRGTSRPGGADLVQAYAEMSVTRGIDDIERSLVRHSHDHPPVRDLNRESDRRRSTPQQIADALARAIGSWPFLGLQVVLTGAWVVLNVMALTGNRDPTPFPLR